MKQCSNQDHFTFVYEEYHSINQNYLVVFNIEKQQIVKTLRINAKQSLLKYAYVSNLGLQNIKLCQTSSLKTNEEGYKTVNYLVLRFQQQKVGMATCEEYQLKYKDTSK